MSAVPAWGGAVPRGALRSEELVGAVQAPALSARTRLPSRQFLSCGSFLLSCWKSSRLRQQRPSFVAFPLQRAVGPDVTSALHRPRCWPRGLGNTLACGWESRRRGSEGAVLRSAEDTLCVGHGPSERGYCPYMCRPPPVRAVTARASAVTARMYAGLCPCVHSPRPVRAGCHP